jgi:hypothetical protein
VSHGNGSTPPKTAQKMSSEEHELRVGLVEQDLEQRLASLRVGAELPLVRVDVEAQAARSRGGAPHSFASSASSRYRLGHGRRAHLARSDPQYPEVLLPVTEEIDASAIMWDFFRTRHSQGRG